MSRSESTLALAERIAQLLMDAGAPVALIGAAALAAHGHVRATLDLDLGTDTDPYRTLRDVAATLAAEGLDVELVQPDPDDPLGGVLTTRSAETDPVQVVNFYNPHRARSGRLGSEAVRTGLPLGGSSRLRVVDVPHLVALKVYAGGRKSELDVLELLALHPDALEPARILCARFRLDAALEKILSRR